MPGIVLSTPFGALADRVSRRRLAVGADLLRAAAFIALAVISSFALTVALALAAGIGTAMFRPAVTAALPGLVTDEQRSPATALYGALISVGTTVGPALTALVLLLGSPTLILGANGVTFLLSAMLLSGVPLGSGAQPLAHADSGPTRRSVWSSTVEGVRVAAGIPGVPALILICTVSILAGGLMNVAEPLLAIGPLRAGSSGFSMLVAAYGSAMVAGSLMLTRAGSSVAGLRRRMLLGLTLEGLGMIGSATAPSLPWAVACFVLTGFGNAMLLGPAIRLYQELVSERLLGRITGLRYMLGNMAFVLAFVSAGAVLAALGVRAVFALGGVAMVGPAVAGWLGFRPDRAVQPLPAAAEPASAG